MSAHDQFHDAIRAAGLDPPRVIESGKFYRFPGLGKRPGNTAGWCKLFDDGQAGCFGDYSTGLSERWQAARDKLLTKEERADFRRQVEESHAQAEADRRRAHAKAVSKAQAILDAAKPATDSHPSLVRKGVKAYPGVMVGDWPQRQRKDCLLIPLRDAAGKLMTVQAIFPSKPDGGRDKDFLKGGAKAGAYFQIGDLTRTATILIAEGYATTASLYKATGHAAVMAGDAGNLKPVAEALRALYPQRIIVCADNDRTTKGNPGVTQATAAAKAIQADLVIPEFAEGEPGSDFNDLAAIRGIEAVRRALEAAGQMDDARADIDELFNLHANVRDINFADTILPDYPQSDPPSAYFTVEQAQAKLRDSIRDVLKNPRGPDGTFRKMLIIAPPGIGKTRETVNAIIEMGKTALILSPTLALAEQTAGWINIVAGAGQARTIRGRLADDPDGGKMCMRPAEVTALHKTGARSVYTSLCHSPRAGDEALTKCPFIRDCGYIRQMQNLPPVITAAHPFLYDAEPKVMASHEPDIVVVDESIARSLIKQTSWTVGAILQEGGIVAEVATALAAGQTLRATITILMDKEQGGTPDERRQALLEKVDAWRDTLPSDPGPPTYPGQPEAANLAAIERYREQRDPRLKLYSFAHALRKSITHGYFNSIWYVPEIKRGEDTLAATLHSRWRADIPKRDAPMLFLDATGHSEWYGAALGGDNPEVVDISLPPPALRVIHLTDSTLPRRHLTQPGWQMRFVALANGQSGTVGLISHKDAIAAMRPHLAEHVLTAAFGSLEGMDHLRDCDTLIVAGRIEPPVHALEAEARALWPDQELTFSGNLIDGSSFYTMRDGTKVPCTVRMHRDARINLLLQIHRDDGLIQAVGRLRLPHGRPGRTLIVATSVPIPGLVVDELTTVDKLLEPERAARLVLRAGGVLPSNREWLARSYPDEFSSVGAAHRWWFDGDFNGTNSYEDNTYSKTYHSNFRLRTVGYRLAGQRGGRPSTALVYPRLTDADIVARLETLHGRPVTLTLATALPEAPAAHLEAAMPVESPPSAEPCSPAIEIDPMAEFMSVTTVPKPGDAPHREWCRFGSKDWLSVDVLGMRVFVDVDVGRPPAPGPVPTMVPA